jgi:hypothetical protein
VGLTEGASVLRDIERVRVDHDRSDVTVRISMRDLRRRSDTSWAVHLLVPAGGFTGDSDDVTIRRDEWAPPGVERSGFLPPYGPRVHAG